VPRTSGTLENVGHRLVPQVALDAALALGIKELAQQGRDIFGLRLESGFLRNRDIDVDLLGEPFEFGAAFGTGALQDGVHG
jgi:hypothetical protein